MSALVPVAAVTPLLAATPAVDLEARIDQLGATAIRIADQRNLLLHALKIARDEIHNPGSYADATNGADIGEFLEATLKAATQVAS